MSFVKISRLGLFFVLKRLKGSGRSESCMSSGSGSHAEVTVAPTCFEAGWSFPQTEFGDVNTLHLCRKVHSAPFVQPFWLKSEQKTLVPLLLAVLTFLFATIAAWPSLTDFPVLPVPLPVPFRDTFAPVFFPAPFCCCFAAVAARLANLSSFPQFLPAPLGL